MISELLATGWIKCKDGDVVSPKGGDRLFITEGTLTVKGQIGGDCWVWGNAKLIRKDRKEG